MTEKIEITIGEDLDGFLGYDSDAIALVDIDASKQKYCDMLRAEILKIYPDLNINFNWDGQTYLDDPEDIDIAQWELEDIEQKVYNSGEFWVYKGDKK
jgi:hypothetical protein